MKILVIDDHVSAEETVGAALATDPRTQRHTITGVRTPEDLMRVADLESFGLAFVDLDFRRQSESSGLYALRILEQATVPAVIYAADDEDNRALLLLAAFQFYDPLALVSKGASGTEIREIVATVDAGARPSSPSAHRYRRTRRGPSVIDRLIIRASDLPLWRALAMQSDRRAIAQAVPVSVSKVDDFFKEHYEVVAEIEEVLLSRAPAQAGKTGNAYEHRLAPMHSFAVEHYQFFRDDEVGRLVAERGDLRPGLTAGPEAPRAPR